MNNIIGDTKPWMKYGTVGKISDLVLDTLVGSLVKEVAGETQKVEYKTFLISLLFRGKLA